MTTSRDDPFTSDRSAETSFEDFARARRTFFEMLRRGSEVRRIAACCDGPSPDQRAGGGAARAHEEPGPEPAAHD